MGQLRMLRMLRASRITHLPFEVGSGKESTNSPEIPLLNSIIRWFREDLAVPALSFQAWAKKGLLVSPQPCLGRNSMPAALSVTQITMLSTPAFPAWS